MRYFHLRGLPSGRRFRGRYPGHRGCRSEPCQHVVDLQPSRFFRSKAGARSLSVSSPLHKTRRPLVHQRFSRFGRRWGGAGHLFQRAWLYRRSSAHRKANRRRSGRAEVAYARITPRSRPRSHAAMASVACSHPASMEPSTYRKLPASRSRRSASRLQWKNGIQSCLRVKHSIWRRSSWVQSHIYVYAHAQLGPGDNARRFHESREATDA